MDNPLKYIYFEIVEDRGENGFGPKIQKENILMLRPVTSIVGYEYVLHRDTQNPYFLTHQVWVDFTKFSIDTKNVGMFYDYIIECLEMLKTKYQIELITE